MPCRCPAASPIRSPWLDGEPAAGIFDINGPEYKGVPESWMPYIAVDNVDERVKKAVKAGAKAVKPGV